MKMKITRRSRNKTSDSYLHLVRDFPLISIKSGDQLEAAQAMMDRVIARGTLDRGEEMYLDALSDLVAVYEDVHHSIPAASDADMLRHLMDSCAVTQADVARGTAIPKSTISEILAGKRPFSRTAIRTLAHYFKVDVSVLASNL